MRAERARAARPAAAARRHDRRPARARPHGHGARPSTLAAQPLPSRDLPAGLLDGLERIEQPHRALARAARRGSCLDAASAVGRKRITVASAGRVAGSPSSSRAIRACPRPSSPRRSWRWSGGLDARDRVAAPSDRRRVHPLHRQIRAPVRYLPEYLYQEPLRVLRGSWRQRGARPASGGCCGSGWRDLAPRPDAQPRPPPRPGLGARPRAAAPSAYLHVHYLHTPAPSRATRRSCAGCRSASRRTPRTSGRRRTGRSARRSRTPVGRHLHALRPATSLRRARRPSDRIAAVARLSWPRSRPLPGAARAPPGAGRHRSGRAGRDPLRRPRRGKEGLWRPARGARARCPPTCTGASSISVGGASPRALQARREQPRPRGPHRMAGQPAAGRRRRGDARGRPLRSCPARKAARATATACPT